MSKVFYRVLLGRADTHLREVPDMLHRANVGFLTERSISGAIQELHSAIKLLEQAKQMYSNHVTQVPHHQDLQ